MFVDTNYIKMYMDNVLPPNTKIHVKLVEESKYPIVSIHSIVNNDALVNSFFDKLMTISKPKLPEVSSKVVVVLYTKYFNVR